MKLFVEDHFAIATIWQEARGEPYTGKVAVGEVIRNRMRTHYASDGTLMNTLFRRQQFSGWNEDDVNRIPALRLDDSDGIVQQCLQAWHRSETSHCTGGAVLYYNPALVTPSWAASCVETAIIGRHRFMKPRQMVDRRTSPRQDISDDPLLTLLDVAQQLRVDRRTVYRYVQLGLPVVKVSAHVHRVRQSDLTAWLNTRVRSGEGQA